MYWGAMAADVVIVLLFLRGQAVVDVAHSMMKAMSSQVSVSQAWPGSSRLHRISVLAIWNISTPEPLAKSSRTGGDFAGRGLCPVGAAVRHRLVDIWIRPR